MRDFLTSARKAQKDPAMDETFDFIIVGSGSAGGPLAARLAEDGRYKVALLEAGTLDHRHPYSRVPAGIAFMIENPSMNWCRHAEPSEDMAGRAFYLPSGKMLGGTSAINGMIYNRGQKGDYNAWAQMGCTGWSYDEVLPHFKALESTDIGEDRYRGRSGPVKVTRGEKYSPFFDLFTDAAKASGLPENPDYSGDGQYGVSMAQNTIARGMRQSTASQFIAPALKRGNLRVIRGAQVTSLILEGKRCTGLRYRQNGEDKTLHAVREVVLSAGTIASPQILELSGIGNPEILAGHAIPIRHALPGVGENMRDHYGCTLEWEFNRKGLSMAERGRGWRLLREILAYGLTRKGFLSQGWATMRVFAKSHPGVEDTDLVLMANPYLVRADPVKGRYMAPEHGFFIYAQVQRPQSAGSIHVKSADPLVNPAINYRVLATETDRLVLSAAVRHARAIAASDPLAQAIKAEMLPGAQVQSDDEIIDYARRTGGTTFHPVGTCKMGVDPMAVVDPRLRVHGIAGLRVADASIMPMIISGNTSFPAMMIGARCAEMILADAA